MAKLYFRHGPVTAAKTMNLLAVAENYERQGKRAILVQAVPKGTFDLAGRIKSRCGLSKPIDVHATTTWTPEMPSVLTDMAEGAHCVLVDEAQFLSVCYVEFLRELTYSHQIPVICYGLRTDLRQQLFDGSRRLFELADSIEEIKTTCAYCNRKAIFNMKIDENGRATTHGAAIDARDVYVPTCHSCFTRLSLTAG